MRSRIFFSRAIIVERCLGISRALEPHLVKGFMKDWTGSQTTLQTRARDLQIRVAFVAIGATIVGSITFTKKKGDRVKKGDEFGYLSFGGSTAICVFEKVDRIANSNRSLETLVEVEIVSGMVDVEGITNEAIIEANLKASLINTTKPSAYGTSTIKAAKTSSNSGG
ncbi:hypothetical protein Lal_00032054 [Lupinus albus]|nr:hypothetical protein Lal_00032054 [Lupinus albus]